MLAKNIIHWTFCESCSKEKRININIGLLYLSLYSLFHKHELNLNL